MRKIFRCLAVAVALAGFSQPAMAQFDLGGALRGAAKTYQALTLSDEQVADYARESIAYMDSQNEVCGPKDPYTIRLSKLTAGLTQADGVPLNFKVYKTTDVNAFACPDGSVRVFSGIMDIMDDNELLGIIGHEIGHVALHHSKKQLKQELMNGALRDVLSAGNGVVAALSASQLGAIGESLMNARYSRKQETQADDAFPEDEPAGAAERRAERLSHKNVFGPSGHAEAHKAHDRALQKGQSVHARQVIGL